MATILNERGKNIWDHTTSPRILLKLLEDRDHLPHIYHNEKERERLLGLWLRAVKTCYVKCHISELREDTLLSSREMVRLWAGEEVGPMREILACSQEELKIRADLMRCVFGNPFVNLNIWVNLDYKNNPGMGPIEYVSTGHNLTRAATEKNWITYEVLQCAKNAQEYQRFPCEECKGTGYMIRKGEALTFTKPGERIYIKFDPQIGPLDPKRKINKEPFAIAAIDIECNTCAGKGYTINGLLDPYGMMVLADELESAGCNESEILNHLRANTHCPNCWVLRMIVGEYQP